VVKRNSKIDDLSLVGHNVQIGENCIVTGLVAIGGSASIGDRCWLAPASSIINGIRIGADSKVGIGTTVTRSLKDRTVIMAKNEFHKFETPLNSDEVVK
jgi:UDP-3-O-[3-hydroxymyristoyl] glucosamine N-acyltransferase